MLEGLGEDASADAIEKAVMDVTANHLESLAAGKMGHSTTEVGDMVAFNNCGAYSYSASPLMFLSHKTPIELIYRHGKITIGRRRLSAADFV